jgi:hypothetical protein
MTPERLQEIKEFITSHGCCGVANEIEVELTVLRLENERLEATIKSMATPQLTIDKLDGSVELRHEMFCIFAEAFASQLRDMKAENFVTAGINGHPDGDLIITIKRATGITPEEKYGQTLKLLNDATDELHECRELLEVFVNSPNEVDDIDVVRRAFAQAEKLMSLNAATA